MRDPIRLWKRPDAVDWEGPGRYGPQVECDQHGTYVVHSKDVRGSLAKYWGTRELVDFLGADKVVAVLVAAAQFADADKGPSVNADADDLIETVEELL